MNITVRYDRVDFFGWKQFTEDSKNNVNFSDLKKLFIIMITQFFLKF